MNEIRTCQKTLNLNFNQIIGVFHAHINAESELLYSWRGGGEVSLQLRSMVAHLE